MRETWKRVLVCGCLAVLVAGVSVGCSDESSDGGGGPAEMDAEGGETGPMGDAEEGDGTNGACEARSETLGVFGPNVFFVIDKSDSMTGEKIDQLKSGLDSLADAIASKVRVGVSGFPIQSCCCSSQRLLELGDHTASKMKMAWGDLMAGGGTPTGAALYLLQNGDWLEDASDPYGDRRRHAVVLVTDGKPNDAAVCEPMGIEPRSPVEQARKLKSASPAPEAPVYVVGFRSESDGAKLNEIARAGGTNAPGSERYFVAGDAEQLSNTLESIAVSRVACSKQLDPAPPSGSDIAVSLGGDALSEGAPNGFDYDEETGTVTIQGDACEQIQTNSQNGIALDIEVGCPSCNVVGGSCSSDGDCCGDATCDGGTCTAVCREIGEDCSEASQCCSGTCTIDANEVIGVCTGQ